MFIQPDKYVAGFKMLGLWKCNPFGATILVAFFPLSGDEREGMEDGARKRVHRLALITSRYPAAFLFRAAFHAAQMKRHYPNIIFILEITPQIYLE